MSSGNWISGWKSFFSERRNAAEFTVTIFLLIVTVYGLSRFLIFNELRQGAVIDDPLLKSFDPVALNGLIFFSIYSSLLLGIISFSFTPRLLLTAFQTYIVLVILRICSMYLIPLEPPQGSLDLEDPLVFIVGTGQKITKDLFFSGHTSTSFMLFLIAKNKMLKVYFIIATVTVGICVLLQKAHYSIDVLAGLVYSNASFNIVRSFQKMIHKPQEL